MELMIKMPTKKNTFSGRCTMSIDEFEIFSDLVGVGHLRLIFEDKVVRTFPIEQWMIDHAEARARGVEEYMLVTYSKRQYQKDLMNAKKFGED